VQELCRRNPETGEATFDRAALPPAGAVVVSGGSALTEARGQLGHTHTSITALDDDHTMGAWGTEIFANDDAMDWIAAFEETDDLHLVERVLRAITNTSEHLEAPACSEALAAAEVVATLLKRPGPDVPSEVFEWIARVRPAVPPELPGTAQQAIDRILAASELRELWDEADPADATAWRAAVADLRDRLQ